MRGTGRRCSRRPTASSNRATSHILSVTRNDWGLEHTSHRTLATLNEMAGEVGLDAGAMARVRARVAELSAALDAAPKGARWKMRARIGERVKWYEEPEEARA